MEAPGGVRRLVPALLTLVLALAGCVAPTADDAPATAGDADASREVTTEMWPVDTAFPATIEALPDGTFLVASVDGRVLHLGAEGEALGTVLTMDVHPMQGEQGLLGMALHPEYPDTPHVYVFRTDPPVVDRSPVKSQSILRFTFAPGDTEGRDLTPVVTGLPSSPVCCHNGGRIAFGPDGMLYATIGDNMLTATAQNPVHPAGSVLRFTPDGDVPADNPHAGSPVVVTGIRNAFGLTFDDEWGMVVTDNGPSVVDGPPGFDEVNLLAIGDNAGWPLAWGDTNHPGMVAPVWHSALDPIAPTGVIVPRGSVVPEWDGKILWCNFNTDEAMLLDPAAADPEPVAVAKGCRFDVTQDPSGRIVTTTTNAVHVIG